MWYRIAGSGLACCQSNTNNFDGSVLGFFFGQDLNSSREFSFELGS